MKQDIETELTHEFLTLFIEKLKPISHYEVDKDFMLYNTGTTGWSKAFRQTCEKLNKTILLNYYNSLGWEDFDSFCVDLGKLIVNKEMIIK